MNMRTKLFFIVAGLQLSFLLGWATYHETRLHTGRVVRLEVVPVDPRDILRGDFVILRYKISTVSLNQLGSGTRKPVEGASVFVTLKLDGEFYDAESASLFPPREIQADRVLIQGKITRSWRNDAVMVDYGIEKYFVPEGKGNPPRQSKISADIVVSRSGKAQLKQLYVDGRKFP